METRPKPTIFRDPSPRECVIRDHGRTRAVVGVRGGSRVPVYRSVRRDAWAEAVRVALMPAIERRALLEPTLSRTTAAQPDDPTVCDEERARLRSVGLSFSEHPTAQARGQEGWVVSGSMGGRRIRAVDDDR
jgi:hypothetical protein